MQDNQTPENRSAVPPAEPKPEAIPASEVPAASSEPDAPAPAAASPVKKTVVKKKPAAAGTTAAVKKPTEAASKVEKPEESTPDAEKPADPVDEETKPSEPTAEAASEPEKEKPKKWNKLVLLVFLASLLLILLAGVLLVAPLIQAYNSSFIDVPIVPREGSYTRPPMPTTDIETISESKWQELINNDTETEIEDTDPPVTDPPITDPNVTSDISDPPETKPKREKNSYGIYKVDQIDKNILNILIVGTDSRSLTSLAGRSDVMLVLSYNKKDGSVKLISLLRDLYVPIEGHGWNRLNTAFAYGGIAFCVNTINDLFGLDIQRFVIVNFEGTKKIVDMCGGVDVALSEGEYDQIKSTNPQPLGNGKYHLDGAGALGYMRTRHVDSEYGSGDFARTARQRILLTTLYSQVIHTRSTTKIYELIQESFGLIKTNIKLDDILDLASDFLSLGSNLKIVSEHIPQKGTYAYAMAGKKAVTTFDIDKNVSYLHKLIYGK